MSDAKYILYDPTNNVSTPITYEEVIVMTGLSSGNLASLKTKQRKIKSIGCYFLSNSITVAERKMLYEKEKYPDEAWKEIEGSNGTFLISQYARVKRVYKTTTKFLLPFLRKQNGSLYVKVKFQGVYGKQKLSHLVAHHFVGKREKGQIVRHKNGIKTDDLAGNLEYICKRKLGKLTGYTSSSKPVLQLNEHGDVINEFRSAREAGRECFISYQTVLDYCNGNKVKKPQTGLFFMFESNYVDQFGELEDVKEIG